MMVVVGVAFLNAIVGQVIKFGVDYLVEEFKWRRSTKSQLQRLKNFDLPRIAAVVEATEKGDIELTDTLNEWLWSLKDALYEADDVLDDLKYLELQKQVEADTTAEEELHGGSQLRMPTFVRSSFSKLKKVASFCCCQQQTCCHIPQLDPILKKLREVIDNLHQVATTPDLGIFYQLVGDAQKTQQQVEAIAINNARATTPMLTRRPVLGRDEQKEEIIQWLMQPEDDVRLLCIVGHGGMGKTTLAQFVLEDDSVKTFFGPLLWAYVSPSFDVMRTMREMLESANSRRPEVDTLSGLQGALKNLLEKPLKTKMGKKFLLVLDDAWDDQNGDNWGKLFAPLMLARNGGRILLTTRSETVSQMAERALMGVSGAVQSPMKMMALSGLGKREYLELFNRHAFSGKNPNSYPWLHSIGKQIANKLWGSPLFAELVGSMLNENLKDTGLWERVRDSNIPTDAMSGLRLSYHYLAPELRPCFAYCSIFRQQHVFCKQDVVRMWMAVGLIGEDSPEETMEEKGSRYFDALLKRSFFQLDEVGYQSPVGHRFHNGHYSMHDLLFELAQTVSRDECFCFTDGTPVEQIPDRVRYLYLTMKDPNTMSGIEEEKWSKLRTLFIVSPMPVPAPAILDKVLRSLRSIRLLVVCVEEMEALPDAIGDLRHLRYLVVVQQVEQWPNSLSKLHHLQFFERYIHRAGWMYLDDVPRDYYSDFSKGWAH